MKIRFYLVMLTIFAHLTCIAQLVTLRGKITDAKTGTGIPGVSILSGAFGTSADDEGNFIFYVQQSVIEESGITASCVGYKKVHLTDFTDSLRIAMTPVSTELALVTVSPGADYIVQRAYRQIKSNYLNTDFNMTGILKAVHTVRDSLGYQYFASIDAKLKLYMSSYADTPIVIQSGLMEKKEVIKSNPNAQQISFVNGYAMGMHDFVHRRAGELKGNTARFSYIFNRKEAIDGRRVYVINFYSKNKGPNAGILYIDTATFAFVQIQFANYNVKAARHIALDKVSGAVRYRLHDGKWVIDNIKHNVITDHNHQLVERTEEFQVGTLLTDHAGRLPAEAVISEGIIDDRVHPFPGFTGADRAMSKHIQKMIDNSFPEIKVPKIVGN